jgi:tRNA threonylcarbamoyladenosine biosynthesis protein TsaE
MNEVPSVQDATWPDPAAFPCRCRTTDAAGTRALGARMAALLAGGEILLLHGPLGAGKTCLVQGLAAGLGVNDEVFSPSFTLLNRFEGRLVVFHLDLYRVEPDADLNDIGVEEVLDEVDAGAAVLCVEWPALLADRLPQRIELLALPGAEPDERLWHWRGEPGLPDAWRALARETDAIADAGADGDVGENGC